jgi:hypothetical protein
MASLIAVSTGGPGRQPISRERLAVLSLVRIFGAFLANALYLYELMDIKTLK